MSLTRAGHVRRPKLREKSALSATRAARYASTVFEPKSRRTRLKNAALWWALLLVDEGADLEFQLRG